MLSFFHSISSVGFGWEWKEQPCLRSSAELAVDQPDLLKSHCVLVRNTVLGKKKKISKYIYISLYIYLSNFKTCILPVLQCLWLCGPSSFLSIFLPLLGEVWQEIHQVHTTIALSHICAGWFRYGVGSKSAEVWFQLQYRACLLLAKLVHYEGGCWYNTSSTSFGKLDWHIESRRMCVCTKSIKYARADLQCHPDRERIRKRL